MNENCDRDWENILFQYENNTEIEQNEEKL